MQEAGGFFVDMHFNPLKQFCDGNAFIVHHL